MDLTDLTSDLVDALVADLSAALPAVADQELYAVCLVTDSDPMTIAPDFFTEEQLAEMDIEEDPDYFRWFRDEWTNGEVPAPRTDAVVEQMNQRHDQVAEEDFPTWSEACFQMMLDALGDPRVSAAIAAVNPQWRPVRYLLSPDPGGIDQRYMELSVDQLNADHPRTDLVESLREGILG